MMKDQRRLTFEQCMRLVGALDVPSHLAPEARAAILEWGEKVILDWWLLNQILAGSIRAKSEGGAVEYVPARNEPVSLKEWPPVHGKDAISEDVSESKSGLFTASWSGEHKVISSSEIPTSWLDEHPEARPRKRISIQ